MTGKEERVSLDLLRQKMDDFSRERNWEQYHTPRNLLLALVGEVGELSEIFQWKGEVAKGLPDWKEEEKVHLGEELSDVLLYLVQLSNACGIDLGKVTLRKICLNAVKYPAPTSQAEKHTSVGCREFPRWLEIAPPVTVTSIHTQKPHLPELPNTPKGKIKTQKKKSSIVFLSPSFPSG